MDSLFDSLAAQKQFELLSVFGVECSIIDNGIKGHLEYDEALKEAREKYREIKNIGSSEWWYGPHMIFFKEHREYYYIKYRDGDKPPVEGEYQNYNDIILKITPPIYFVYNEMDDEEWDIFNRIIVATETETTIEVSRKLNSYKGLFLQLLTWDNLQEMLGDRDKLTLDFPDGRCVRFTHKV